MSSSELRFRRTVKIDGKEESVDLLTLALKKEAEYDKVCIFAVGSLSYRIRFRTF